MKSGEKLLAEIWKAPTDRQLLSVYADWLVSEGDTARAEYMQLSLLPKLTPAQKKRRNALENKHRGAWLGAARPFVWTWEEDDESPGFIAECQCQMAKLTKGFEHVRALGPRLVVTVTAPKAKRETIALAKLPLGTLYGLALREADAQWITDDLMTTIAPALDGLRALVMYPGEARASEVGWRAMVPHLTSLEHLELALGENPDLWLEALLASKLELHTLSLPGWIPTPMRKRILARFPVAKFRSGEQRVLFDRGTGYYIPNF
jgi:uncharacterized protein (TIGR02996 family)